MTLNKEITLSIKNVFFKFDNEKDYIYKNLNLDIARGEVVSIIGSNGAGKSTLIKLIIGLLDPEKGTISRKGRIGLVSQVPDNQFVGATVEDDIAFGLENLKISRSGMISKIDNVLEMVRMANYKHSDPHNLSGGQQQRVAIAGVIVLNPDILILDEATSMLDPVGKNDINNLIRELKNNNPELTIINITHDMDETLESDKLIVINHGKIISDKNPQETFFDKNLVEDNNVNLPIKYEFLKEITHDKNSLKKIKNQTEFDELFSKNIINKKK